MPLRQPPQVPAPLAGLEGIRRSPLLTRAEVARLLVALNRPSGLPGGEAPIMTDIIDHPAREAVVAAVGAGLLDPFPNHRFKPDGIVSRAELADALARAASGVRVPEAALPSPADVPPTSRHHDAVRKVLALGLLRTGPDGSFSPTAPSSGQEGWDATLRLAALLSR